MIKTKNKQLVPELRFGEFEGEWDNLKLAEVCEKIQDGNYGGVYPKAEEFIEDGIPFLTSKAFGGDGFLKEDKINYISLEKHLQLKKAHLKLNDVLFTNRGSNVGAIGFSDERIAHGNIGPQLTLLRSKIEIIKPIFLYQIMTSHAIVKQIRSQDSGSAMNFFGIGVTSKFKLNLPSLPEQQKIASFLSTVDKKIQDLTKKKELLEQYKKGVMQKLFSGELRFRNEDGKAYPDWEEKRLGEICEVNPKNKKLPSSFVYIDLESVKEGQLIKETKIELIDAPSRAQRSLKINDILYQTVRPYQKNNLFFSSIGDYVASTGYAQLRTMESSMYIFQLLHFDSFVNKVLVRCTGTSYPAINSTDLAKIIVSLPVLPEQQKIATYLSSLDTKIESVANQITQTQTFKKGLLQKMFV